MHEIKFTRTWAMPNRRTFSIKPIKEIIERYKANLGPEAVIIDPFANDGTEATITNDLDPDCKAEYHLDALDFLSIFPKDAVDMVLYDPPYSPRQVAEHYKRLGKTVNMQTTQASYWSKQKAEIARIVRTGGVVVCCGWNSGGIGKKYGFKVLEILLVPHGGNHHDTIVTVERKDGNSNE